MNLGVKQRTKMLRIFRFSGIWKEEFVAFAALMMSKRFPCQRCQFCLLFPLTLTLWESEIHLHLTTQKGSNYTGFLKEYIFWCSLRPACLEPLSTLMEGFDFEWFFFSFPATEELRVKGKNQFWIGTFSSTVKTISMKMSFLIPRIFTFFP